MKVGSIISLLIFISGALLTIAQLWFTPLSAAMFIKVMITLTILLVVAVIVTLVIREYVGHRHMKDNGFID